MLHARSSVLPVLTLVTSAALTGCGEPNAEDPAPATARASAPSLEPIATVPEFSYLDQTGGVYGTDMLRGRVWVANFIFTTCPGTCPQQTEMMGILQGRLAELGDADTQQAAFDKAAREMFTKFPPGKLIPRIY